MTRVRTAPTQQRSLARAASTLLVALAPLGGACTEASEAEPSFAPEPCTAGEAAIPVPGCDAGIPPERCGEGFEPDGAMRCEPVLPAAACGPGEMAIPGETACREVAPCGAGPFGDIPVEPSSQHVDAAYSGGASDGSESAPWTTIGEAIIAAEDGAVVAIAAGSYAEDVIVEGKSVSLWGVCPTEVEIVGSDAQLAAVVIRTGADGTELHGLAVTGAAGGVRVEGSSQVLLDQLWIHDTADRGVTLQSEGAPVQAVVSNTLIDGATVLGVQVAGADLELDRCAVRSTREQNPGGLGQAVAVQRHPMSGMASTATIRSSLFEQNRTSALMISGSAAAVEASVLRDTQPSQLSARDGVGLIAQADDTARAELTLVSSVVESSYARGVALIGADATVEATLVRDTLPQQWDSRSGEGIAIQNDGSERAEVTVADCVVERSRQSGILVRSSVADIRSTIVRQTAPREEDDAFGRGIAVVRESPEAPVADATVEACRIEDNFTFGIYAADATVAVTGTFIATTKVQASNGQYGDGIGVVTLEPQLGQPATLDLSSSRIDENAHSAVMVLGANLAMGETTLDCNPSDLVGRSEYLGKSNPYGLDDRGQNVCGCGTTRTTCEIVPF
ncbi:MAG: DUF1565 domain-containing protein [Deltaproteobacteria bacterium]|jgi:hypothetical protein|nr:DUF1565 domain-containing protein [Deltaproteobacteria bacterium]MBW2534379.1 DUF1565 domain-containing protein [Deltaproteobacteria bacterium]